MSNGKIRVAIIGTGKIGMDLLERILRDPKFELVGVIGRREESEGMLAAREKGVRTVATGLDLKALNNLNVEGYFDASSSASHIRNWKLIKKNSSAWVIDLTPSRVGIEAIPMLDSVRIKSENNRNFSMVTCGGQSAGPLVWAMCDAAQSVSAVEVSSSIASDSAGPATRRNVDDYIEATESAVRRISGAESKAILVMNPALPQIPMRTSVTVSSENLDIDTARKNVAKAVEAVARFVPGYSLVVKPCQISNQTFMTTVAVEGEGLYLPRYAGNLDIINAAAIETARLISEK